MHEQSVAADDLFSANYHLAKPFLRQRLGQIESGFSELIVPRILDCI